MLVLCFVFPEILLNGHVGHAATAKWGMLEELFHGILVGRHKESVMVEKLWVQGYH